MPLNDRQRLFVREYLKDFNASKAAERAGYSKKTAASQGGRLLQNVEIQSEIGLSAKKILFQTEVTVERVINELAALAFCDPADFYDESGDLLPVKRMPESARRALSGLDVEVVDGKDGPTIRTKKVRHSRKEKALEMLGRYLKMFEDNKPQEHIVRIVDLTGAKSRNE